MNNRVVRSSGQQGGGFARDMELLDALARAQTRNRTGLRLTDLAVECGREKSQVSRALRRLQDAGVVNQDERSREFTLGWRLYQLAALTAEAQLVRVAEPVLRQIVESLQETAHLCVLRGHDVMTLHSELPRHGYRGSSWVGNAAPAHAMSAGRVLLAEWDEASIAAAYPRSALPGVRPTAKIRTRPQLIAHLADVRRLGYCAVDGEFEAGLVGASAAIRDFRGVAVASINVAAPKARLGSKLKALGERLATDARTVSTRLGGSVIQT